MPVTKAQALVVGLAMHDADPASDAADLERLAVWALRYSPIVAVDGRDGLVIETTGADHLFGGEAALAADVGSRLRRVGVASKVAISDTWGASHALARFSADETAIAPIGCAADAVSGLPIAALRLGPDVIGGLRKLGFERIENIARTPRAPLTLRFGPGVCRRLDQAGGRSSEPIEPVRPAEIAEVKRPFAEPIGAPETLHPGFGVEMMRLAATLAEPFLMTQSVSSLIEESDADVSALIDVLGNRVGEDRLYRFSPVASDVPERSMRCVAATAPISADVWPGHWPRPARLLAPPEPIQTVAVLPDHPPVSFTWRGVRRRVARADGPERVFGEWWKRNAELVAVRDYFQVEDDAGERFWIFRAGNGEDAATGSHKWFMHGIFA